MKYGANIDMAIADHAVASRAGLAPRIYWVFHPFDAAPCGRDRINSPAAHPTGGV
jgi:hypothetical protein